MAEEDGFKPGQTLVAWRTRVTPWSSKRLERLYQRYNRLYWGGRLPNCYLAPVKLSASDPASSHPDSGISFGVTDAKRRIAIDVGVHKSDRAVRETLLHEMVHVAMRCGAHKQRFIHELERLVQMGAPLSFSHLIDCGLSHWGNQFALRMRAAEDAAARAVVAEYRAYLRFGAVSKASRGDVVPHAKGRLRLRQCFCSPFCRVFARRGAKSDRATRPFRCKRGDRNGEPYQIGAGELRGGRDVADCAHLPFPVTVKLTDRNGVQLVEVVRRNQ